MFPRVQTTSGHANPGYQPNNPYEMRSTSRDFPEKDYDDLVSVSHSPVGMEFLNDSTVGHRHCWNLSSPLYILPWSRRTKWYKGTQKTVAAAEKHCFNTEIFLTTEISIHKDLSKAPVVILEPQEGYTKNKGQSKSLAAQWSAVLQNICLHRPNSSLSTGVPANITGCYHLSFF